MVRWYKVLQRKVHGSQGKISASFLRDLPRWKEDWGEGKWREYLFFCNWKWSQNKRVGFKYRAR